MQFVTDDQDLAVGVILDREHPAVDLTADGLGVACLDAAVAGMLSAHEARSAPEGRRWAPLARSTVAQKGHRLIGIDTGRSGLLDPQLYLAGPRDLQPREAWWSFPTGDRRLFWQAHGWQNGNLRTHCPARRLLGWSRAAQDECRRLIARAEFAARE
jgi:hypothetical protein